MTIPKQCSIVLWWAISLWKLRASSNNWTPPRANSAILGWGARTTQKWSLRITSRQAAIMSICWSVSSHAKKRKRSKKKRARDNEQLERETYILISWRFFAFESLISIAHHGWIWRALSREAELSYFLNWLNTIPRIPSGTSIQKFAS